MKKTFISIQGINGRMGKKIKIIAAKNKNVEVLKDFLKNKTQVVVDFSSPQGAMAALKWAQLNKKPIIIGTTGFKNKEFKKIKMAAKKIPVLYAPNMSPGINLIIKILKDVPQKRYNKIKIIETHHTKKKDKPSGTAIKIKNVLRDNVPILSIRKGDVVGEHEVIFENKNERLIIKHQALNREVFASGALEAAKWIKNKRPGLYAFEDIFGDKTWQ
ncbi:MAG: 4-hydroxy-tetrahydrodipicolinate reductase [Oligoflexia bacterium]|nr:4-hydroxy-tetrahydrodipicolinate reductase [Oligoflexia bacterium]